LQNMQNPRKVSAVIKRESDALKDSVWCR